MEETTNASAGARKRGNDLDETGRVVADNVRRLRRALDLTTGELARELTKRGRAFLPNTITKIEQQQRRVDVDDLMALAAVLGVTPNTLLLPTQLDTKAQPTAVAEPVAVSSLWKWACGETPLPESADPALPRAQATDAAGSAKGYEKRFRQEAAPHTLHISMFMNHAEAIRRTIEPMDKLLTTLPAASQIAAQAARNYSRVWGQMAKVLEDSADTLASEGSVPDPDVVQEVGREIMEIAAKADEYRARQGS